MKLYLTFNNSRAGRVESTKEKFRDQQKTNNKMVDPFYVLFISLKQYNCRYDLY